MGRLSFGPGFRLGVATSAYQIEGAASEEGKGPSIWDEFTHRQGTIQDESNGDVACDHYHRYSQDVDLIAGLGCDSYRFSISWPRVLPEGRGKVNEAGLDFYDRLTDELLAHHIEPFVTLYHWDLPLALEKQGGWTRRPVARWFAEYTEVVLRRLGDRVRNWITLNEPISVIAAGYASGDHAPGCKSLAKALRAAHFQMLAHGKAVQVIRGEGSQHRIGIANALSPVYPLRKKDARLAARINSVLNGLFLDPIYKGRYPHALTPLMHLLAPVVRSRDLETIRQPIDFVGVNHYSRYVARRTFLPFYGFRFVRPAYDNVVFTDFPWEVYPYGLYEVLRWVRDEYDNPSVLITENGAAFDDEVVNGRIQDSHRIDYFKNYLRSVDRARREGCRIDGYFVWSLLDNFEWSFGYTKKFGLVHVDFRTQRRTFKESGLWYAHLCHERSFTYSE